MSRRKNMTKATGARSTARPEPQTVGGGGGCADSGHEPAVEAAGGGERVARDTRLLWNLAGSHRWRRPRGLGSGDGTTTLTAKLVARVVAIGQQYKRTSPHRPWRSRHRGLTLTGRGEACLGEIHASILRKHLHRLEHPGVVEHDVESEKEDDNKLEDEMHEDEDDKRYSPEPIPQHTENQFEEEDGSFSPQLMHGNEDEDAIDPEEDKAELDRKREAVVLEHQRKVQEAMKAKARVPDEMEMKTIKTMGAMEEGDAVFGAGAEVNLDSQVYWWHDKYRPRKPKYFNRVHTGYEWNKYNQTHYDHDNPRLKLFKATNPTAGLPHDSALPSPTNSERPAHRGDTNASSSGSHGGGGEGGAAALLILLPVARCSTSRAASSRSRRLPTLSTTTSSCTALASDADRSLVFFDDEKKEDEGGEWVVSKKGGDSNDKGEVLERKVEDFFRSLNKGPGQADTKAKRPGAEPRQVKREVPREEERPQPYLVTRTTELPPRSDGPAGTVVLIDKPKGDAFPLPFGALQVLGFSPKGWTSFTVCGKLRRLVKVQKVGHAGTLDPMATGLLIVCVGKATKIVDSYQGMVKGYSSVFRLGEATSTWDADSPIIQREPWEHIKDEDIRKAAASFKGQIWQVPPMFSAIKVGGEKMYDKARRGETVELSPRRISIYQFDIERSLEDRQNLIFRVTCSKGTYIQSLCADLGKALGSCAHLTALRRDSIGEYSVNDACNFDELEQQITKGYL
ncbi:unnamed protein product [Miscanthus lutarioriparius]|uniref:tRNA pseudouridine(55) synthase n=1 Tax=Miscanthus lutarioriparius TaxID=422564 RepID=A0A811S2L5_9POAL|nr:unnamed protein product [Miscanthus lutarioriparius]